MKYTSITQHTIRRSNHALVEAVRENNFQGQNIEHELYTFAPWNNLPRQDNPQLFSPLSDQRLFNI
jgi:hypothetical protein